jgi:hypothetical protein
VTTLEELRQVPLFEGLTDEKLRDAAPPDVYATA